MEVFSPYKGSLDCYPAVVNATNYYDVEGEQIDLDDEEANFDVKYVRDKEEEIMLSIANAFVC